jgi:hypothetical protein
MRVALPCRTGGGGVTDQRLGHFLGLGVVQLEGLGAHRLQVRNLLLGFQIGLLLGRQFFLRRDPQHIARLAHAQALGLQDDVQGLIPGHILQAQGDVAGHGVAGHDVEVGEVGDHLQQGAHFDVLEVQRQLLALVAGALDRLVRIHAHRPDLQHELVVGLVGTVLPGTGGMHHHPHPVTALGGRDALHRRAEVGHVQLAAQVLRQGRLQEVDHQVLALLAQVHANLCAGQPDDHRPEPSAPRRKSMSRMASWSAFWLFAK